MKNLTTNHTNPRFQNLLSACSLLLTLLLIVSCKFSERVSIPDNKGYLVFNLDNSRTILPATKGEHFDSFLLKFTSDEHPEKSIVDRTYAKLSEPIWLEAGEWTLEVTAFIKDDSGYPQPAATLKETGIVIKVEEATTLDLKLEPIFDQGTGTFEWDLPFSADVTFAQMVITSLTDGSIIHTIDLLTATNSYELASGQYSVLFTLEKIDHSEVNIYEILHIYQNMTSFYSENLETYSIRTEHTITFDANGGSISSGSVIVTHNNTLSSGDAPTPTRDDHVFDCWCTDRFGIKAYEYSLPVYGDMTLYAKWIPVASVNITITPPATGDKPDTNPVAQGYFVIDSVTWSVSGTDITAPDTYTFLGTTVYSVKFELTVFNGYTFQGLTKAKVILDEDTATLTHTPSFTNLTVSYTFIETDPNVVTSMEIETQPKTASYTHGDTLVLSDLVVTLIFNDGQTQEVAYNDFGDYSALFVNIGDGITSVSNNTVLSYTTHNNKPITIKYGSTISANSSSNLSIAQKTLNIIGVTHTKVYDGNVTISNPTNTITNVTLSGIVGSEVVTCTVSEAEYTNENVNDTMFINIANASLGGADSGNYTLSFPENNVSVTTGITRKSLTITGFNITKTYDGDNTVKGGFGTLSFNGLVSGETAEVNTSGVTATYTNAPNYLVGTNIQISISGTFGMTGGTATASNYTITQPTGLTGAITLYSPSAPGAPTLNSKTTNSVTLNKPNELDSLDTYLTLEYARNNSSTAPNTGWQDSLTFTGLSEGTTYYFFARYKYDATKNIVSAASASLSVTTPVNAVFTITYEDIIRDDAWLWTSPGSLTISQSGSQTLTFVLPANYTGTTTAISYSRIEWRFPSIPGNTNLNRVITTGFNTTDRTLTLASNNFTEFDIGGHPLTVIVDIGGMLYNRTILITVVP